MTYRLLIPAMRCVLGGWLSLAWLSGLAQSYDLPRWMYGFHTQVAATFTSARPDLSPTFSLGGGGYAQVRLTSHLYLGSGFTLHRLRLPAPPAHRCDSDPIWPTFLVCTTSTPPPHVIELRQLPLWLSLRLHQGSHGRFQLFLRGGYSGGLIRRAGMVAQRYHLPGLRPWTHMGQLGLEGQWRLSRRYVLLAGGQFQAANLYQDRYGEIYEWSLSLRLGRLAGRKT